MIKALKGIGNFFIYAIKNIAYTIVDLFSFTKIVCILIMLKLFQVIDWGMDLFRTTSAVPTYWYYMIVVLGVILATMLGGYVYINKMDKAVQAIVKLWQQTDKKIEEQKSKVNKLTNDTEDILAQSFTNNAKADVTKQNVTSI